MNKVLIFLVGIFLVLPTLTASGDAPITFTVRNNTTYNLATVLLNHASGSPDSLGVSGYGTFAAQVDENVPSITMNGQTVSYPNTALVTLASGTVVRVRWESAAIVIIDVNEI